MTNRIFLLIATLGLSSCVFSPQIQESVTKGFNKGIQKAKGETFFECRDSEGINIFKISKAENTMTDVLIKGNNKKMGVRNVKLPIIRDGEIISHVERVDDEASVKRSINLSSLEYEWKLIGENVFSIYGNTARKGSCVKLDEADAKEKYGY